MVKTTSFDNYLSWFESTFAKLDVTADISQSQCPPAAYCERMYAKFVDDTPVATAKRLRNAYVLATTWDLMKVVSYRNISVFKRVWAASTCLKLIGELAIQG